MAALGWLGMESRPEPALICQYSLAFLPGKEPEHSRDGEKITNPTRKSSLEGNAGGGFFQTQAEELESLGEQRLSSSPTLLPSAAQ